MDNKPAAHMVEDNVYAKEYRILENTSCPPMRTWLIKKEACRHLAPTGLCFDLRDKHLLSKVTWLIMVEGHVPKGVEVQVLSSAFTSSTRMFVSRSHVTIGNPYRHMVFSIC
jgi:hypothetical protein